MFTNEQLLKELEKYGKDGLPLNYKNLPGTRQLMCVQNQYYDYEEPEFRHEENYALETLSYMTACHPNDRNTIMRIWSKDRSDTSGWLFSNRIHEEPKTVLQCLRYHSQYNLLFSANGYRKDAKRFAEDTINLVKCLAIDIHYKKSKGNLNGIGPQQILRMFEQDGYYGLPIPTFIEYGHELRFVWVLKDTVKIPKGKKGKGIRTLLKRIPKVWSEVINGFYNYHAEPAPLNLYLRVPGSCDQGSVIGVRAFRHPDGEIYDLQELIDVFMPDLPEWYDGWKEDKKSGKRKKWKMHPLSKGEIYNHNVRVIRSLEIMRDEIKFMGLDARNNRNLCWIYFVYQMLITDNDRELSLKRTLAFNNTLNQPIPKGKLILRLNSVKEGIRLTNKKILAKLEFTPEYASKIGLPIMFEHLSKEELRIRDNEAHKKAYHKKQKQKEAVGDTRKQRDFRKRMTIFAMFEKGYTRKQIAKAFGCTRQNIYLYAKKYANGGKEEYQMFLMEREKKAKQEAKKVKAGSKKAPKVLSTHRKNLLEKVRECKGKISPFLSIIRKEYKGMNLKDAWKKGRRWITRLYFEMIGEPEPQYI